jgi:hypothetical protein
MRPTFVEGDEPIVEIGLQVRERAIELLAERHPIELVERGLVKALNDVIRLGTLGLVRE